MGQQPLSQCTGSFVYQRFPRPAPLATWLSMMETAYGFAAFPQSARRRCRAQLWSEFHVRPNRQVSGQVAKKVDCHWRMTSHRVFSGGWHIGVCLNYCSRQDGNFQRDLRFHLHDSANYNRLRLAAMGSCWLPGLPTGFLCLQRLGKEALGLGFEMVALSASRASDV